MFSHIYRIDDEPASVDTAALTALDLLLGGRLPAGYREFVTELGEGFYSGYVRVYPPDRVLAEHQAVRDRIADYWFWDAGAEVAGPADLAESVILADTVEGDEVFAHPASGRLLVLPRNDDKIYAFSDDVREVLTWLTTSGVLTAPIPEPPTFQTRDGQRRFQLMAEPGLTMAAVASVLGACAPGARCDIDSTSDDPSVVQYLPDLGGYARVEIGHRDDVWVTVVASASASLHAIDNVLTALVDVGLVNV